MMRNKLQESKQDVKPSGVLHSNTFFFCDFVRKVKNELHNHMIISQGLLVLFLIKRSSRQTLGTHSEQSSYISFTFVLIS